MNAPFVAEVVDYPNSQAGSGSNNPSRLRETGSSDPLRPEATALWTSLAAVCGARVKHLASPDESAWHLREWPPFPFPDPLRAARAALFAPTTVPWLASRHAAEAAPDAGL